jgi:hypothetical protein
VSSTRVSYVDRAEWIRLPRRPDPSLSRARAFVDSCRQDIAHPGGVLGAGAAAAINVFVPGTWLQAVGGWAWCCRSAPRADAFVAASTIWLTSTT